MEDTKPLVGEEKQVQNRNESFKLLPFGISGDQDAYTRNKLDNITIQNVFKTASRFAETFREDIKPLIIGEKAGWPWMSRKTFDTKLSEILDYPDFDTMNKINGFSP